MVNFWTSKGYKVMGFVPEYLLDDRRLKEVAQLQITNPALFKASKLPDNAALLKELHKKVGRSRENE